MRGIAASPGIAIGKAYLKLENKIEVEEKKIKKKEIEGEISRLAEALEQAKIELMEIKETTTRRMGENKAEIFRAHLLLLDDPELIPAIEKKITEKRLNAEAAVKRVIAEYEEQFSKIKNGYIQCRIADIKDVSRRIIYILCGYNKTKDDLQKKVIYIAKNLAPSDLAKLDTSKILAFVIQEGSSTSHVAIMIRSLGIPAIVGLELDLPSDLNQGDLVIVDGNQGKVIIKPEKKTLTSYQQILKSYQQGRKKLNYYIDKKAQTEDDYKVDVVGNIGNLEDVDYILKQGGEGIGLFRTEFLYMDREKLPSEEEQFQIYRQVGEKMKGKPVVVRTLDIGGDKDLPYLDLPGEMNPFLGYRAIRICLDRPDIFKPQLKAILRASNYANIKLMYPLISSLEELKSANQILKEARGELLAKGVKINKNIEIGIMIELPAAVMIAARLAKEVDFFSIGSNDLIQYTLGVDRTNEKIANLCTPYHPAILKLIKETIVAAHRAGIRVDMCGEMAGEEALLPFLLGLGLDGFSMSAVSILRIKQLLSKWKLADAQNLAKEVLKMNNGCEIKQYLLDYIR